MLVLPDPPLVELARSGGSGWEKSPSGPDDVNAVKRDLEYVDLKDFSIDDVRFRIKRQLQEDTRAADFIGPSMFKLYVVKLFVLASITCAQASSIPSIPPFATNVCPGADELESSMIIVDGHEIVHRSFTCPGENFNSEAFSNAVPPSSTSQLSSLEARSQAECTTPATECQCGIAVDCSCVIDGILPSASDCQTLVGSTAVLSSLLGPSFLVQPKTFHVISLNTCSLGFLNLANFTEEFCWDDLGNQGNSLISSGCFGGNIGFTSGICLSTNQRFLTRLGHTS